MRSLLKELLARHSRASQIHHNRRDLARALRANSCMRSGGFLDNRVATINIDLVSAAITSTWGSALLTPGDVATLFGGVFPSRAQMLAAGKRVYFESNSCVLPSDTLLRVGAHSCLPRRRPAN